MQKLKVVIVGDESVGKTSLLMAHKYAEDAFSGESVPTIFGNHEFKQVYGNKSVYLLPVDTVDHKELDKLRSLTYPNTDVFIVCFSLISQDTLLNVRSKWHPEVAHYGPDVPLVLVGTKLDLRDSDGGAAVGHLLTNGDSSVSTEMGEAMAREIGAVGYVECSAAMRKNLDKMFNLVTEAAVRSLNKPPTRKYNCTLL